VQPSRYATALRDSWVLLVVGALFGVAVSLGVTAAIAPSYRASTTLFFAPARGQTVGELNQGSTYTQSLMESFTQVVTQPAVLDPVIALLKLPVSSKQLAAQVEAETPLDSLIMTISVTNSDADQSAAIANAVAIQLRATVTQLVPQRAGVARPIDVTTVAAAQVPLVRSGPSRSRNAVLGLAAGLALAALLALVRTALPARVRGGAQVTELTGLPVLVRVPSSRAARSAGDAAAADAYRRLRLALSGTLPASDGEAPPVGALVVVTSCGGGARRSTAAARLAASWAESGVRVLLVDADLRSRPDAAETAGARSGLSAVLRGQVSLESATTHRDGSPLHVLESGPVPPDAGALVSGPTMRELLAITRARYEVVVVDTPPLLTSADALVLGQQASGLLLVVDTGRTTDRQLLEIGQQVQRAGVHTFGAVVDEGAVEQPGWRGRLVRSDASGLAAARFRPAGTGSLGGP